MNKKYVIVGIVITLAILGFLLYTFGVVHVSPKNIKTSGDTVNAIRDAASSANPVIVYEPGAGWVSKESRIYKNLLLHFSLVFPKDLKVREYDDKTSASTITFEDDTGEKGFQIFVVPYTEDYIKTERFKKDVPSGVMQEPVDIIIDGARATMFYSKNDVMGDTREIWFIKNGFLYEVTTYARLDSWLALILSTWRFL